MKKRWQLAALMFLAIGLAADQPGPRPVTLVLGGLTQDTLEPCGCGGTSAGGLARRAELMRGLRAQFSELVSIDLGGFGVQPDRLPVTFRALAALGVDAAGLASDDLRYPDEILPLARRHAIAVCSLAPPERPTNPPLPRSLVVGPPRGPRVGVVSVEFTILSIYDLIKQTKAELAKLRGEEKAELVVLISHLPESSTEQLMAALEPATRPELVAQATQANEAGPPLEREGSLWVSLARRGRSIVVVQGTLNGGRYQLQATAVQLEHGPEEPVVAGWIDEYYKLTRAGERVTSPADKPPSFAPPSACEPCHAASVAAWRKHPHALAVDTLEAINRDVSACLTCHSERLRRDGVRPEPGPDRGVVCATCHSGLPSHIVEGARRRPLSIAPAGCRTCHTPDTSQRFEAEQAAYLASVTGACAGTPQERLHPPPTGEAAP